MSARCYIVGAGDFSNLYQPGQDDFIIAADAGFKELISGGVTPDLVVGDFDSLGSAPAHPLIEISKAEKDDTDMMLAVKQGLKRGFKTFIIDGGLGGRMDQTYANFQILTFIARNCARGILLGRDMCATAIKNGTIEFLPGATGYISVFSAGERAGGVTLTGLKYPLRNAELTNGYPLGVSNEFTGAPATVTVCDGTLIIIWTGGADCVEL